MSILVKAQGVQSTSAQLGALDKTARKTGTGMAATEAHAKRTSKSFSLLGAAARTAGPLVGAAGLAAGLKLAVSEFREAQKTGAQTTAVLKSTGNAAKVSQKQIEGLAGAISKKSGIDDEAIQSGENLLLTFTKIRNEQGKGNDIFNRATQVITDMSVSMKQGLKPSAIQVGKALNDPVKGLTALGRVGVQFTNQQKEQIKTMVESGNRLGAQKVLLRELTTEFGGSAAAQATAGDKFKVAMGNLAETVGSVLVPQLDKATVALTNLINQFIAGEGVARAIIPVFKGIGDGIASTIPTITAFSVAVNNVATRLKPVFNAVASAWRTALGGFVQWLRGWVELVTGILTLDFRKAWQGLKNIAGGAIQGIIGVLQAQTAGLRAIAGQMGKALTSGFKSALNLAHELAVAMRDLISKAPGYALGVGKAIVRGIINGITSAASGIGDALKGAVGKAKDALPDINPFGDGIGKVPSIVPVKGGGNLMGARPIMSRFAAVGAANGLHVSSGLRPGSVTSSGNTSYHSTGEAVDLAGSPAGMMKTFKTLRSRFGSKLAELIYTPGGAGIKNGKPNVYTGQVAADHFDHVHVAFDTGKPGVGDGLGKMRRRKPGTGDGIGVAIAAARKAGFTGEALVRMVAIAGRESNYRPTAKNLVPPDHSIGLWQINQLAHHGRFGTDKQLEDPDTNAHAAWVLSGGGKNFGPWSTNRGLSAARIEAARKAIAAGKGGGATAGAGGSAGGGAGAGPGAGVAAGKVSNFEMISAMADTALASAAATPGSADDVLANTQLRDATTFRIKQVRKALKKRLSPSKRLALTQELGTLVGKHTELQSTLKDLRSQPAFDVLDKRTGINDAALSIAQGTESLADDLGPLQERVNILGKVFEETQKKFGKGSVEAAQAFADLTSASQTLAKTQRDAAFQPFQQGITHGSAALTMAQVWSPKDFGDDLAALQYSLDSASAGFDTAVAMGDEAGIIEFGGQVLSLRDSIEQLTSSTAASAAAQNAHTDALNSLKDEIAAQNAIATSTLGISLREAQRALADMIGGQLGGYAGVGGRALTAGSGSVVRY